MTTIENVTFESLGLTEPVLRALVAEGYNAPDSNSGQGRAARARRS